MHKNLFGYIWLHTKGQQLWILTVILVSLPFYFMSLELPKRIVNGPIQGRGFDQAGAAARFLEIKSDLFGLLSEPVTLFAGVELERLPYLIALSMLFLILVCVNGLFKFYINTYKGRLGERMLRRLRYELVDRVLRFPVPHFRKVKASEVATMVKDEVEPLGGFIGDAFVQPAFLAGQAITAMAFILVQNIWLGLIASGIVLVQGFLIPKLRKRLLVLGKQQQLTARELAGRVGEVVDGITEVRVNDASNFERADLAHRLGRIFFIRYELYQRKFFVKFLNNFLAQVTPFLFFLIGGYFAILGSLDIGQLVAVIAAYKDLPSPIKELIDWDQQRQDVEIKYGQVVEQFAPENMLPSELQEPAPGPIERIPGPFEARGLSLIDETGAKLIEHADISIAPGERVSAVGEVNGGAESVSEVLMRLVAPTNGRIRLGDKQIEDLPEAVIGRRLAYVGPDTYLRNTSLQDSLLYGLRHHPSAPRELEGEAETQRKFIEYEAQASGNMTLDIEADWIDYDAAGASGPEELAQKIRTVLTLVDLDEDVFELGLRSRPTGRDLGDLAKRILSARDALRRKLAAPELKGLVEPFDPAKFNGEASIAENLLFGAPLDASFATENLAGNAHVLDVLKQTGLDEELFDVGRKIASTVIELFAGLPPDHPFFDQLSLLRADELPLYETALARVSGKTFENAQADDKRMILGLAFGYIENRHRLGLLSEETRERIVAARKLVRDGLPDKMKKAIAFIDPEEYNAGWSLEDNILFGRIAYGIAEGPRRVRAAMRELLEDPVLRAAIFEAGLGFNVGTGGRRLSSVQRQKVGLARALLKRPDLLIVNRGLSALGSAGRQAIIERVLEASKAADKFPPFSLFWVTTDEAATAGFDRVLLFKDGRIVEEGRPSEVFGKGAQLARAAS